jgi:anti-sigma factor RsiW
MACDQWRGQLDAYLDGELASAQAGALSVHMRSCASCAADALERVQLKRTVAVAGKRYEPSSQLRARIAKTIASKPAKAAHSPWRILLAPALALLLLSFGVNWYVGRETSRRQRIYSELADLHVNALASATPVDVVSTDRHTVKPWFQGKIPFSFNLPELQGTEFTLLGGRVTYLAQTPGAHLIYQLRKHEISVFIFPDSGDGTAAAASNSTHAQSFNMQNWTLNGLRYFVVGDVNAEDIQALSKLLRGSA